MNRFAKMCVVASVLLSSAAYAGGNVNGTIGSRSLDEDEWEPLDRQPTIGVLADFQIGQTPLYIATGFQVSADDDEVAPGVDATAAVVDLSAGLKLMSTQGVLRPYVGLGIASVGVAVELDGAGVDEDDDDQSFGAYFGGGAILRIGRHFNLGADLRWIRGTDIELFEAETDADSFVASVLIGYGWD